MNEKEFKEMLLNFIKNREHAASTIEKDISNLTKSLTVLKNGRESLDGEENAVVRNLSLAVEKMAVAQRNNSLVALISVLSSSFESDAAMLLNKLGMGQEALRAMFKNKMDGK